MDSDSSGSSHCSSYREEYWQLKNQYDEVLESNSQMVLRLEEAKLMLFKSTKDLQRQNGALMSENMNLRAQKEYLLQQLEKFRTRIDNLLKENESQKSSVERQEGCLYELAYLVDSVADNKDNNLTNPDNKASTEKEKEPFLNPTALHELDKQLRASKIGSYYLPVIEEEPHGDADEDDDDGYLVADDGTENDGHHFNATRIIYQSTLTEPTVEVQEFLNPKKTSTPTTPIISKIGKRKLSNTTKKRTQKDTTPLQEREKTNEKQTLQIKGHLLLAEGVESKPHKNSQINSQTDCSIPENISRTVEQPHSEANWARIEPSGRSKMVNMEPGTSRQMKFKSSNRIDAQELMETKEVNRYDQKARNEAPGILQRNSERGSDHTEKQEFLLKAKEVAVNEIPLQLPNEFLSFVKNAAVSHKAGDAEPKLWDPTHASDPGRSPDKESMHCNTRLQDECIEENNLVPPISLHERTQETLQKEAVKLSTTRRNGEALEMEERQGESKTEKLERRISMNAISIRQSNTQVKVADVATKRFQDCQDKKENDPQTQAIQTSSSEETMVSEMLQSGKHKEIPFELNETPLETHCSGKKKTKQRITDNRQDDACATEDQHVILTLARKSHVTSHSFIPSNILSPILNRQNSTNTLGTECGISLTKVRSVNNKEQYGNRNETNISGLNKENLVQWKTSTSLSISMRDLELPTSRIFIQSQKGSPLDVLRASVASKQSSCYSNYGTPKARRQTRADGNRESNVSSIRNVRLKELENLLSESAAFLGDVSSVEGSVPNQHRVTRARSKARRKMKEVET